MSERPTSRGVLLLTVAVLLVVGSLGRVGYYACYPFTLLATWVHEMGHGVTALALGGAFSRLLINADASGLAYASARDGWPAAAVSLGGLLAPPVVGTMLLVSARGQWRARIALVVVGVAMVASTVLWVRTTVGLVVVPALAMVLLAIAWWGSGRERMFVAQLVALRLALDTLTRGLAYLFSDTASIGGKEHVSDIAATAQVLGGPRIAWSVAISALSVGLVLLGLWLAWRRSPTSGRKDA